MPKEVKKYVPNYEYILYDISHYRDEDIRGAAQLKILLTIFRDILTKEPSVLKKSIQRSVDYLLELEDQSTAIQYFETFIRYVFHASGELTNDDFHDITEHVEKTYPEESELVMTLAERFQEMRRKQGIEQGIAKTAIKLIAKYVAPVPEDLKNKIYQQEIDTLDLIIDRIDEFKTIEEVERLLK